MYSVDKIRESIVKTDPRLVDKAQKKLDNLTKPKGSLGRLELIARQIVAITGNLRPKLAGKYIVTMAADHGVVSEGVSVYPKEVTAQMVYNFLAGGAAINVLAKHVGASVQVVDIGVDHDFEAHKNLYIKKIGYGTANMARGQAMTDDQALQSINTGIEVVNGLVSGGCNIIGTGDMGIGNTTASSAIASVLCDADIGSVTGRGTGVDDKGLKKKIGIIAEAIRANKPDKDDALDVLAKVGGFEIGGIAGLILGAAINRIPVVIDGFISGAGALVAEAIAPLSRQYMLASHCSVEIGHTIMLKKLKLKPMFDFDMRLGEGTGAALGIGIAEAAVKILEEMATFDSAGVSKKSES
ncbi:MAG: nicotinate-nucleotide--dimethylbenzimidazole phosphoribosyltransferase [Actinomycetota bacterium]